MALVYHHFSLFCGCVMAAEAALRAAPAFSAFSRTCPEIHKTIDGNVIVEDELLNFIVVKMRTLSQDEIITLVTNHFTSERIESSKKVLFEVCTKTTQRLVSHKGAQKDINNVKLCLKVLNECGDDIPKFVSHFLDELPPVSFTSIDVSVLLGKMQQINYSIAGMQKVMEAQVDACESLRAVTKSLDKRLVAVERQCSLNGDAAEFSSDNSDAENRRRPPTRGESATEKEGEPSKRAEKDSGEGAATSGNHTTMPTAALLKDQGLTQPKSPSWNLVVSEGKRRKNATSGISLRKPSSDPTYSKPVRKKPGIIGTGTTSIQAVQTKMVSVFATRFDPCLEADTLSNYLKSKLGRAVECRKIETVHGRFSSFHVTAECKEVAEMYDPDLWPTGSFVRRYYEARQRRLPGASVPETLPFGSNRSGISDADMKVAAMDTRKSQS